MLPAEVAHRAWAWVETFSALITFAAWPVAHRAWAWVETFMSVRASAWAWVAHRAWAWVETRILSIKALNLLGRPPCVGVG